MKLSPDNKTLAVFEAVTSALAGGLHWLEQRRWWALALSLPAVLAIHLAASAITIQHSNQDSVKSDQGAEMWLAATSREDLVPQRTDGVRHPLWSWVARWAYVEDAETFFVRGKWINVFLSVAFLSLLGLSVARWLDPLATTNLLLLSSLGILVVRGTYFQPEPLYYVLSFLAGVLAWRILCGAGLATFLGFGFVSGLAYLSKPSLLPFLLAFGLAFFLRGILELWRREGSWPPGKNCFRLLLAGLLFGGMLIPLGRFSAEAFGTPFFNYTKMWMWTDDFHTEAWPFQDKYPGRLQLETLTAEETPSVSNYFRRHTLGEALQRGWTGTWEVTEKFFFPEEKVPGSAFFWRSSGRKWSQPLAQRGVYLFLLGGLVVALALWFWLRVQALRWSSNGLACAVFLVGAGGLYAGLYGWYSPVGRGDRFMGSLWIPAVFLLTWAAFSLRQRLHRKGGEAAYFFVHGGMLLSLLLQVAAMFSLFGAGIYMATRN